MNGEHDLNPQTEEDKKKNTKTRTNEAPTEQGAAVGEGVGANLTADVSRWANGSEGSGPRARMPCSSFVS